MVSDDGGRAREMQARLLSETERATALIVDAAGGEVLVGRAAWIGDAPTLQRIELRDAVLYRTRLFGLGSHAAEIAQGIDELGTGGTPAFVRGYNAGFEDAWAAQKDRVADLRHRLLAVGLALVCGSTALGIVALLETVPK